MASALLAVIGIQDFEPTLPFARELTELHAHHGPARISKQVRRVDSGYQNMGIYETISFSDGGKSSYLWYPTTVLRIGSTYEFVVLPHSRMILDYRLFWWMSFKQKEIQPQSGHFRLKFLH